MPSIKFHLCVLLSIIHYKGMLCLLDLILNVSVNNFSVMLGQVFLGLTSTKQRIKGLSQGNNTESVVRFEPAKPQSRVKHSTTEPLHSSILRGCRSKIYKL